MLHSHPQVVAYPELYLRGGGSASYAGRDVPYFESHVAALPPWSRRLRSVHRIAFARRLYEARPGGVQAVGFKLMYNQAHAEAGLLAYLAFRRAKVVHLVRANGLDALISYRVAKAAGSFHPSRGEDVAAPTVRLDADAVRGWLEDREYGMARARSALDRYRLPRLDIAYEELVGRRDETFARVLRFLDVDDDVASLDSSLVKAVGGRHLDLVENADAVRAALVGTRFEWMLDGPQASRDA
jgi:hypothetical protein